jgi:hypothetical protein
VLPAGFVLNSMRTVGLHCMQAIKRSYERKLHVAEESLQKTKEDASSMRQECTALSEQVSTSTSYVQNLESRVKLSTDTIAQERATTLKALGEYQKRDMEMQQRVGTLEQEVEQLSCKLREEQAAVLALKRQTLVYQTEIDQAHKVLPAQSPDAGLQDVLVHIKPLLDKETNPVGERYAVSKIIQTHNADLSSSFLFYCQLKSPFANHWPLAMHQHQWFAFCKDTETADPRIGARQRSSGQAMLSLSEIQEVFDKFGRKNEDAHSYPTLTFDAFVAAVVWVALWLKPTATPFLSEALRSYIVKHVALAKRVQPGGVKGGVKGTHNATTVFVSPRPNGGGKNTRKGRSVR